MHEAKMKAATKIVEDLFENHDKTIKDAVDLAVKQMNLDEHVKVALRQRLWRLRNPKAKKERPTLICKEDEELLVDLIAAFSVHANPLTKLEVRALAQVMGNLDRVPSKGWLVSLRKRYPTKIKTRKAKASHNKKVLTKLFESLKTWSDETSRILASIAVADYLVFNIDETRALPASKGMSVIASAYLTQVQYEKAIESTLYTLVGCYAADGTTLFILYLFRAQFKQGAVHQDLYLPVRVPSIHTRTSTDVPVYVASSPKGYMNAALWKETMKIFVELVGNKQGIGRPKQAVLYLDGCSSHRKEDTEEICLKNNITPIYFPSNTSHIVQPADGQIFECYKPEAAKETDALNFKASLGSTQQKHFGLAASLAAHEKAVTPPVIKAAFKSRGIFPFNRAHSHQRSRRLSSKNHPCCARRGSKGACSHSCDQ